MDTINAKYNTLVKDSARHYCIKHSITSMKQQRTLARELKTFLDGFDLNLVLNELQRFLGGDMNRCNIVNTFFIKKFYSGEMRVIKKTS